MPLHSVPDTRTSWRAQLAGVNQTLNTSPPPAAVHSSLVEQRILTISTSRASCPFTEVVVQRSADLAQKLRPVLPVPPQIVSLTQAPTKKTGFFRFRSLAPPLHFQPSAQPLHHWTTLLLMKLQKTVLKRAVVSRAAASLANTLPHDSSTYRHSFGKFCATSTNCRFRVALSGVHRIRSHYPTLALIQIEC